MSDGPCPRIEAVLDAAFRAVTGSPCLPVPPEDPAERRERLAIRNAEILRLRRAGWKLEAIAAQLGTTEQTVSSVLKRARRAGEVA